MSSLPKLKVKSLLEFEDKTDICDLEQAKNRFEYGSETIILVEGEVVNSHEELVQLANRDQYQNTELLEVVLLPFIVGG